MTIITASMFMALDGVVDPTIGHWHFPYFNDEMAQAVAGNHDADVMLFGRVTYDSFAGAWPAERSPAGWTPRSPRGSATCARSLPRTSDWISLGGTPNSWAVISWKL